MGALVKCAGSMSMKRKHATETSAAHRTALSSDAPDRRGTGEARRTFIARLMAERTHSRS